MLAVRTVLHPTDFSEHAQVAFEMACALARDYGAQLIILHVGVPPTPMVPEAMLAFDLVTFEEKLRADLERVRPAQPGVHPEHRLVIAADPVAEIVRVARRDGCDLIVMGTRGRTGLRHLLLGSVAERVMRAAPCPVITVRAPARAVAEPEAAAAAPPRVEVNA